ncbi:pilus assembly protein TadG-related protein [Streptomyces sp. KR80]|uniref:pilus assembly protein TadG-related protein n=1 Tax=Streptomyces sp. KR80 TaxID=3457426 RepID=UPI003FD61559
MASLLFLAFAYFAVGQAAATRNGAQGAADAAALAAAQDARDQLTKGLLGSLLDPDSWEDLVNGEQFGTTQACDEAQRFAEKNNAGWKVPEGHCERLLDGREGFNVKVKTRNTVGDSVIPGTEDKRLTAEATAVIVPRCELKSPPGKGVGNSDDPKPDKGEDHKPPFLELDCDDKDWVIDPENGDFLPDAADLFSVRLDD